MFVQPNLHTPTITLLPGNPLPLTFFVRVTVCVQRVCVVDFLSVRDTEGERNFAREQACPAH